ncbi:hypothetical protein NEISICOT_00647 [Neisseria sicca ATCC 29256]|jgi:hypothetical protein|uniref:Uncharacterized protein n=1 Tax=Neisseria sicca ATCC 29256 TaxID=547045 RepID=C6M2A8_NEISI|nr:hypothetical protein [Neisseria sicca]EET45429.1 hypothetical protein NEISICOT_00647 [Neisseria sicca ATCC 29256]QMT38859.1 hypothetical protein H3L95_04460 [Neisseria sicca]
MSQPKIPENYGKLLKKYEGLDGKLKQEQDQFGYELFTNPHIFLQLRQNPRTPKRFLNYKKFGNTYIKKQQNIIKITIRFYIINSYILRTF